LHAHKPHTKPAYKRSQASNPANYYGPNAAAQPLPPLSNQPQQRPYTAAPPIQAFSITANHRTPKQETEQPDDSQQSGPTGILKRPPSNSQLTEKPKKQHSKSVEFYVQHVHSLRSEANSKEPISPMPITVDNLLPVLSMKLGDDTAAGFALSGLCDSCGALNTGYTPFHQWIYATHPHLVKEYREFDDNDPFEPIKLLGAIRHPSDYDESKFGMLTAIIRYITPYKNAAGETLTLSFALGNDVSTNTIFGLPTLDALQFVWDISSNSAHSKSCGLDFPIHRRGSKRGLPDGVTFDAAEFKRTIAATSAISPMKVNGTQFPTTHHSQIMDVIDEFDGDKLTKRYIGRPS
jgi:hypothetical protein